MLFVSYFFKKSPRGAMVPGSIIVKNRDSINNIYDYDMVIDYIEAFHSKDYVPLDVTIMFWKEIGGNSTV